MKRVAMIILLGTAISVSCSQWCDAQWVKAGQPNGGWITDLAVQGKNLYASTRQGGIFLSTDDGATWTAINSGLPKNADFQAVAVSGENLFAGTVGKGGFRSSNNGTSWTAMSPDLAAGTSVWRFAVSGTDLFAVAGRKVASVYLSNDNGTSWDEVNSGMPEVEVLCLGVMGTNLFAGTYGRGVFFSEDYGNSWTEVNSGIRPDAEVLRLVASGNKIFAGSRWGGRVIRSTDNGASWQPIFTGLPHFMEFSLSDLAASGNIIFLGSFRGVYYTTNSGDNWTAINSGFSAEPLIYALAVSETSLFAGTEGGVVWRLPLSDVSGR